MVNDYNGNYSLRVVTIADGVEHIVQEWPAPNANMAADTYTYTLTAADHGVGAEVFHVAWVYDGNSFNINNWYVDDIVVTTTAARGMKARGLEYYKVFLDGVLVAETEEEFHQYAVETWLTAKPTSPK